MKRFLALVCCVFAIGVAVSSCGGGGDSSADKLTIVGAGS
jgi:hypothetical protein